MLNRLRRSISLTFFLFSTVIVGAALVAALMVVERQYENSVAQGFQNTVNTVVAKLVQNTAITTNWLSETEIQNHIILRIEDNGKPFFFRGVVEPSTNRDTLLTKAKENDSIPEATLAAFSDVTQKLFYVYGDNGESYRTSLLTIPHSKGTYQAIILWDEAAYWEQIASQRRTFLLLGVAAVIALFLISRLLAKRAVEPTARSIKQQTDFVAAASHELRSPLAVIQAGLQASAETIGDSETLAIMRKETERLSRLTDDLLFLATSDAQSWYIEKQYFSPDTLCLNLYEAYRPVAMQKEHTLELKLPDDILPDIYGDQDRIEQVLIILLNNAIAHTAVGTRIILSAQRGGNDVLFTVADNGGGIPQEDLGRIFDRFYKADKSRSDKNRLGLGLSIAKKMTTVRTIDFERSNRIVAGHLQPIRYACLIEA